MGGRIGTGGGGMAFGLLGVVDKRAFLCGGWSCFDESTPVRFLASAHQHTVTELLTGSENACFLFVDFLGRGDMPRTARASALCTVGLHAGSARISLHGPCECSNVETSKSTIHLPS